MLDAVSTVAFEMAASKGVFALLLGSGISRSAKIPTGWDITLNLVRQIAALKGQNYGADEVAWYKATFGKVPDYSELLDQLATTPALRHQVIRPYIEPTDDERKRGEKLPTSAHRSIASLMGQGYVRVVLTTNFDQLLEQALADLGVHATVISSADQVAGALPLVHSNLMIVKLHGDYLDTRIRNTAGELSMYEPPIERLLDQVLDEFGLIICGWSGDWDVALKAAIDRCPSRRFPTYWAARSEPSMGAKSLIARRSAQLVMIDGADAFFDTISQRVVAVDALKRPHPLSADIAVTMLKEYLPEQRQQIRLHDMVNDELNRVVDRLEDIELRIGAWSPSIFAGQVSQYLSALEIFLPMAYTAGKWSSPEQAEQWVSVVKTLALRSRDASGPVPLVDLRSFPATLVMYAFGLGAVVGRRPAQFGKIVGTTADFNRLGTLALGDRLNIASLITDGGQDRFKAVASYGSKSLPGSELLADVLRPVSRQELRSRDAFDEAFARLELALTFSYIERIVGDRETFWMPPGRFVFDRRLTETILSGWHSDFHARGNDSELCVMASLSKSPPIERVKQQAAGIGTTLGYS